jgi:hypothetical protein
VTGLALGAETLQELTRMRILMTCRARTECRMIVRVLRFAFVTFRAWNRQVLPLEGVSCRSMIGYLECRRLEPIYRMTAFTVTPVGSSQKLPVVLVFMTVRAFPAF